MSDGKLKTPGFRSTHYEEVCRNLAFREIILNAEISNEHDIVTISFSFSRDVNYGEQKVSLRLDREEFKKALGF